MALQSKISAKYFNQIGLVGQSTGFIDFTKTQIEDNGGLQTMARVFKYSTKSILTGILNPTIGKEALMSQTQNEVDVYLNSVFTDVSKTYDANIYVLNVKRLSESVANVLATDINSLYVERDDFFTITVRIEILVS